MLEKYGHGGDLRSAQDLYGFDQSQFVDFSSNMNPLGPPQVVEKVLSHYINDITAYPDPAVRELRKVLSQKYELDAECFIVGNGAAELIDLLVRYFQPKHAAIVAPSFVEYEQALQKVDCEISYLYPAKENQFALTEAEAAPILQKGNKTLFILGHPNNPTGQLLTPQLVKKLLISDAIVIVDEAFIDFHCNEEMVTFINDIGAYHNLYVIRSMTKFYSIPGIRLGFAVGNPQTITQLKELQYPWSVNSLAQQIGIAVVQDEEFVKRSKSWLIEEQQWMLEQLSMIGLIPFPTVTNYVLVALPEQCPLTSEDLQLKMGQQGVLIRNGSTFKGLDNSFIRLAIKSREQNQVCINALKVSLGIK